MSTPKEPKYRQRVGYQAMLLGGFTTMATVFLVVGNLITKEVIAERLQEDLLISLNQVIPEEHYSNNLLENPLIITMPQGESITVYRGMVGMKITALAWELTGKGYAGDIRIILGLDSNGSILGARVLSHTETPGLGDKIEVQKDDWILEFNGLYLGNPPVDQWKVKKDGGRFDAFSGATITPRAVVNTIREGLSFFNDHKTELLSPPVIHTESTVME